MVASLSGGAWSRDRLSPAATDRPETHGTGPPQAEGDRPSDLRLPLSAVPFPARRIDRLQARYPAALASDWLSPVLALEVAAAGRSPRPIGRPPESRPTDQSGEPALGCAAHPWRAAQARHRRRSVYGSQIRRRGPPSQSWKTCLRNHAPDIAAIDLFVVRTIGFKLLYGLAIIHLERRHLVWTNVTANPTSEWIARQITEAFPWDQAPRYIIRDNDSSYGPVVTGRTQAMGIRDRPTRHLRQVLRAYADYYNRSRTHLALAKDAPLSRPVQGVGSVVAIPLLGGLHHQ